MCGESAPVTRRGHSIHEKDTLGEDGRACFNCDQRMVAHITKNFLHGPNRVSGAQGFVDDVRGYWSHPAVLAKLSQGYNQPTLQAIEGEGQEPRKEGDERPNLKIIGWKTITADVQECFCGKPVRAGDVYCTGCRQERDENDRMADEEATNQIDKNTEDRWT